MELMKWADLDGRDVKSFDFLTPEGEASYASEQVRLTVLSENCGDRLEAWIVARDEHGWEIARTNIKNVSRVEWVR